MSSRGTRSQWREQISQPEHDIVEERNVKVPMRDGVELAVNVFRPDAEGEFPALVAMAGYGKETQDLPLSPQPLGESAMWDGTIEAGDPEEFVPRGYAHVVADVRGTGDSGGAFTGMMASHEGEDGHDLIEWIADQPWCDGSVGMTGYSYFSFTTLKTALEQPEHLEGIFVSHALSDFYRDGVYPGGVLNMFYYGLWDGRNGSSGIPANNPVSKIQRDWPQEKIDKRRAELLDDPDIRHQPNLYHLLQYPFKNPMFYDMLMNPYDGEFWEDRSIYPRVEDIDVPAFVIGKNPHSLKGFWELYEQLDTTKKLLVKPPGPEERPWREDVELLVRWFDHWLKDIDTGLLDEPPIEIAMQGSHERREETEWPVPDVEWEACYLRRRGQLSFAPERYQAEPDSFLQEPLHVSQQRGSVSYVSQPIPGKLQLMGPASLTFYASIDQPDTTWIVSLSDVRPDGSEVRLEKTYLKASHRAVDPDRSEPGRPYHPHTEESVDPVEPGEITEYTVGLGPFASVLSEGHRLKLTIESMESPLDDEMHVHYHPHLCSSRTTLHKIYRNDEYRSHLTLPTVNVDDEVLDVLSNDSYLGGDPTH